MANNSRILFLTLRTFSATGGIEKVNKLLGKVLYERAGELKESSIDVYSMYDKENDVEEKYFSSSCFFAFNQNKIWFSIKSIVKGLQSDVVILSHVNLLLIGACIKLLRPKIKLVLIAHGIEVWRKFSLVKLQALKKCDNIICVSSYTQKVIKELNNDALHQTMVINNCIDPYLKDTSTEEKKNILQAKHKLSNNDFVLMTIARLSAHDKYKGYDKVLESVKELLPTHPDIKYLLIGKYDEEEKQRIEGIINNLGICENVIMTGFVPDEDISDYYNLCDLYIMPSQKEGFGIVFIEALFFEKPVIAGNKDGAVDALMNGELGILVNPNSVSEITDAIKSVVEHTVKFVPHKQLVIDKFGFESYRKNIYQFLESL